ncbi:hypothetical protein GGX14DRAFT_391662 [Mycena pura]|uniref:Uncharacterized protein n=1 Tax=Mycena pura TaxID=153505 RepID=A0AAD6VKW6_9AGAR|nr:hypothetical protein GGX14DRAFT_391662 [Mycena pura]
MSLHLQPLFSARHRLFLIALLASHFVSGTQAYIYLDGTDPARHIQSIIAASISLTLLFLIIAACYFYVQRKRRAQAVINRSMAQYPFQGGPMYGPDSADPAGAPPDVMQPPAAPPQAHVLNNTQDGPFKVPFRYLLPGLSMLNIYYTADAWVRNASDLTTEYSLQSDCKIGQIGDSEILHSSRYCQIHKPKLVLKCLCRTVVNFVRPPTQSDINRP